MSTSRDEWAGRIVFVLACALAVSLTVAVVVELTHPPVRASVGNAIAGGFGAMVGIIAFYVYRTRRKSDDD